ncbi:unnamed protein product [Urochloa humidicola]
MIWYLLILTMILAVVPQLWNEWGFRFCVVFSLGANVILGFFIGTRRRSASGGCRATGQMVLVLFLWVLYQLAETDTTSAIGSLTLCDSDVSEDEKQLVTLWAPFLLLHLGGPDNLTAYSLEDNKLSARKWFEMIGHFFGVACAIYKYTYHDGHNWVLLAASVIMFFAGAIRYIERAYALWKANLDKMQEDASSSSKKTPGETAGSSRCHSRSSTDKAVMAELKRKIESKLGRSKLCDEEALLLAQDLFPIWRHAMVDSSVMAGSNRQLASEKILWLEWRSMCKVAEMELSLIYEVLYTKATVAYNWLGWYYLIRFLSPLFTGTAALLFWLHRHQQQQQQQIRGSFVGITYAILVIDFLLDLAWLLRALGSTWAYGYLQAHAPAWLPHQVLCPGRWHYLHRLVICVDPMRLLYRDPVISYRTWSGTIGRYNLLRECSTTRGSQCPKWLVSLAGDKLREIPYLSKLPQCVKELLFERVKIILQEAIKNDYGKKRDPKKYYFQEISTKWGEKAFDLRNHQLLFQELDIGHKEAPKFGKDFEEDVLTWHIATCIFLQYIRQKEWLQEPSEAHAKAIVVMSEYMMFLVAVRREMLPGLVLHSLREEAHKTLVGIWGKRTEVLNPNRQEVAAAKNEDKLAMILRRIRRTNDKDIKGEWIKIEGSEGTQLLWDAVELFGSLRLAGDTLADRKRRWEAYSNGTTVKRRRRVPVPELLKFIFNVWVDKLVYAAVKCNRESHAKQLSAGGDLTTVLWMVIQHAGPFFA